MTEARPHRAHLIESACFYSFPVDLSLLFPLAPLLIQNNLNQFSLALKWHVIGIHKSAFGGMEERNTDTLTELCHSIRLLSIEKYIAARLTNNDPIIFPFQYNSNITLFLTTVIY